MGLTASYYNSGASLSESISVDNANFNGVVSLTPFGSNDEPEIQSQGFGTSTNSGNSESSDSISLSNRENNEKVGMRIKTKSGGYGWQNSAQTSFGESPLTMKVIGGINSGKVEATLDNQDSSLNTKVNTKNSLYSFNAFITPDLLVSIGQGVPQGKGNSQFSSEDVAENQGKRVIMNTIFEEELTENKFLDQTWADKTELSNDFSLMAAKLDLKTCIGRKFVQFPIETQNTINAAMNFEAQNTYSGEKSIDTQYVPRSGDLHMATQLDPDPQTRQSVELSMLAKWRPPS